MTREEAKYFIRANWRTLITDYTSEAKDKANRKTSYICPFCEHGANGDGLTFNPKSHDGNGLKCFGCGWNGDIIDLHMRISGDDYNKSLSLLAERLGITIDRYRPGEANTARRAIRPAEDPGEAIPEGGDEDPRPEQETPKEADYSAYYLKCIDNLNNSDINRPAIAYLNGRGLSYSTLGMYGVGYDPQADPANVPGAMGNEYKPHPAPRIIFPVSTGYYVARSIDPATPKGLRKLNPKGATPGIFNEGGIFTQQEQNVFVTEAVIDALSIIEAGGTAVATNSTSNISKLIKAIEAKGTAATLILCFDMDKGGRTATETIAPELKRLGIKFIDGAADICGSCKDANEALQANREVFISAVTNIEVTTAARPDNTKLYIDRLMKRDVSNFRSEIKTGFDTLDMLSGGGLFSGLYILAAISSLGKTTLALQMADQLAERGNDVIFFSLEQSRLELVSKSLARTAATISGDFEGRNSPYSMTIRSGKADDSPALNEAISKYKRDISDRMSIVEGNFNCTVPYIENYVKGYMARTGVKPIIFIDYLQVIQPTDEEKRLAKKEFIDNTITRIKQVSRDLNITIFAISSVNRTNYNTPIAFESLKESGNIEFTADAVYGLQLQCLEEDIFNYEGKVKEKREKIEKAKAENPRKIQLKCLKSRYSGTFGINYKYYPKTDKYIEDGEAKIVEKVSTPKAGKR